ncbi:hypothetical protein TTHT_2075 [Thermotomaculum hydrothermale]|uniref:Lipid A 3-O-deacylase-related protein n=1 Tax=Thermotomaculum hydrothermale TaxID=981385 RepID=A0A7R6PGW9_9BACT|nr:hypothetical protein [Thermotomaculum hydrothermale]BBB33514.1 hypothetical protein TTHT_2075 [Thermotomaculum hydrothermale]
MKKFLKFFSILFLSAVIILPLQAQTIEKNNYFIINYNFIFPYYDLRRVVNERMGQGISIDWQNYHFKNFPLDISFEYNEWGTGKSRFKDWNTSRVVYSKFFIGWLSFIHEEKRRGLYSVLGFSFNRWRIEKDGNFYLSTTKFCPDIEVGYITKNNWIFSARGTGIVHLSKDIKLNTSIISIGKRF